MKKLLAILLVLCMCFFMFACTGNKDKGEEDDKGNNGGDQTGDTEDPGDNEYPFEIPGGDGVDNIDPDGWTPVDK